MGALESPSRSVAKGRPLVGCVPVGAFSQESFGDSVPKTTEAGHLRWEAKNIDRRPLAGDHHRLVHYRDTFPDDPNLEKLYVSVCRVQHFGHGFSSKKARSHYSRLRVYTQWVEASICWDYTKTWGRPPALHYKKGTYGHE